MTRRVNYWLIRVGDGNNFKNSKYPIWGVKRGKNGCIKSVVEKFKPGDILFFITNKDNGGKVIAIAEYTKFYDRKDESLIKINTVTNKEQNWKGNEAWDIQIHYKNLYNSERQNIEICVQCAATILEYKTFKDRIKENLNKHYNNFKKYGEPIYKENNILKV